MRHLSKYMVSIVLILLATLPAWAQEKNAAFYIYQNDGHFDGFFYDEVQKISYSFLDTLGIEHDEVVSQEIVTADSVYRIMLTAIDSVSFVQPEIKFNPKVRFMRDEGMTDYLLSAGNMTLIFSGDMPEALRPQKDDVLSCPDVDGNQTTFVGKVTNSYEFDGKLVVHCKYITEPTDVFQQFITVEEVVSNETAGQVRRRIAGMNHQGDVGPRRIEGNYNDYGLCNFNIDYEYDWHLSEHWNLMTAIHAGFGIKATLVYKINLSEFYIKAELKEAIEFGAKIALDGHVEGEFGVEDIPVLGTIARRFSRIPFPASMPLFYGKVIPEPFIRAEAHLNMGLTTGVGLKVFRQSIEIMDHYPYLNIHLLSEPGKRLEGTFALQAELSGMVQLGMKFQLKLGIEDWFKEIYQAEIGETIYSGPKLTGNFTLSTANDYKNGFYEAFKDTKINLSLYSFDNELKAVTIPKLWKGQTHEQKFTRSFSFYDIPLTLFPTVSGLECEVKGDLNNTIAATIKEISGDVFLPQHIGIALYDKDDKVYKEAFRDETYFLNTFNSFSTEFTDVEPGNYKVRPVIRLAGTYLNHPVYKEEQKVGIGAPILTLVPNVIEFDEDGGSRPVGIFTSKFDPINCWANKEWIKATVDPTGSALTVEVEKNPTFDFRSGKVYVEQPLSNGETLRDTLTVNQYGEISVSKSKVDFEVAGGTEIITVKTMLPQVRANVTGGDGWLIANLGGEALTITTLSNYGSPRKATITLSAYNDKKGGIVTTNIEVSQEGIITLDMDTLYVDHQDAYYQVTVSTNAAFASLRAECDKDWITCSPGPFTSIHCTKNNATTSREGHITIIATAEDGKEAKATITIIQNRNPDEYPYVWSLGFSNDVNLPAQGGSTTYGVRTNVPYEDLKISGGASWVRITNDRDGIFLKYDTNSSGSPRECKMKIRAHNQLGSDELEVTIKQASLRIVEYDGIAVTLRRGGDIECELFDRVGCSSTTYPTPTGVYGTGSASIEGATLSSSGSAPSVGSWTANFTTQDGLMYGSFSFTKYNGEHISFSIAGAPYGSSGPLDHHGSYRGAWYWSGDAVFSYPSGVPWGLHGGYYDGKDYLCGFTHYYVDRDGNIIYDNSPVEVNVFLRYAGKNGTYPLGHPDAH